jgi:hypothetical protein
MSNESNYESDIDYMWENNPEFRNVIYKYEDRLIAESSDLSQLFGIQSVTSQRGKIFELK